MEGKGWGDSIIGKNACYASWKTLVKSQNPYKKLGVVACDVSTGEAETAGSLGLTGTTSLSYLGTSSSLRSPVSKSKVNH